MPARTTVIAAAIILIYFFALSHRGLKAYFTGDDVMNIQYLHGEGQRPLGMLFVHAATVLTPEYRPVGGIVYRGMYRLFGLSPLPFRVLCYALLLLNLGIGAAFCHVLTKSRAVAAFATLIFAFHSNMPHLYCNTGTIYDLLCFTFGISALLVYVRARGAGRPLAGRELALFLVLFCLALDSKEMAITWPLLLIAYEFVFLPGPYLRRDRTVPIAIAAIITALYGLIKTKVTNPLTVTETYHPHLNPATLLAEGTRYYSLLLWNARLTTPVLLISLAILLALAIVLRSRPMIFALLFVNIALIPVCAVGGRAGFALYIPYIGWALYAACLIVVPTKWLPQTYYAPALFALLAVGLYLGQRQSVRHLDVCAVGDQVRLQSLMTSVRSALPTLPNGARVLMLDDQFLPVDWRPVFLLRLAYHDPTIWVDRPSQLGPSWDPTDLSAYCCIVRGAQVATSKSASPPPIAVDINPAVIQRNQSLSVSIPGAHACPLDVEYRLPDDELARSIIRKNWCALDAAGRCSVIIDPDFERGHVDITRVRLCRGPWTQTRASFEIVP